MKFPKYRYAFIAGMAMPLATMAIEWLSTINQIFMFVGMIFLLALPFFSSTVGFNNMKHHLIIGPFIGYTKEMWQTYLFPSLIRVLIFFLGTVSTVTIQMTMK